jgi:hypothetical protein
MSKRAITTPAEREMILRMDRDIRGLLTAEIAANPGTNPVRWLQFAVGRLLAGLRAAVGTEATLRFVEGLRDELKRGLQ